MAPPGPRHWARLVAVHTHQDHPLVTVLLPLVAIGSVGYLALEVPLSMAATVPPREST